MPIKLLIADDDSLIRESLKIIIGFDADFEVVAAVENGREAVEYCKANEVEVALLDVRMPILNGVQAIKEIGECSEAKCLILTTFDEDAFIKDAMNFGAKGYILKNNSPDKIKDAIRAVNSGNMVVENVIMEKVMNSSQGIPGSNIDKELFTERELEIMNAISEGLSNREISGRLFISEGTVKNYISSILSKTGLEHRTQIAIYYLRGGNI